MSFENPTLLVILYQLALLFAPIAHNIPPNFLPNAFIIIGQDVQLLETRLRHNQITIYTAIQEQTDLSPYAIIRSLQRESNGIGLMAKLGALYTAIFVLDETFKRIGQQFNAEDWFNRY
jgi:hypothetical protein